MYPEIDVVADEAIDDETKKDLHVFLKNWLENHIFSELSDLINLIKLENNNQYIRALAFRLYENNGVLKRDEILEIVSKINKEDRKQFRSLGIKIGRYHVFLPRMLKPKAVKLRILLWKFFNGINNKNEIPKSGLNFLNDQKNDFNSRFLLLCGFELKSFF